MVVWSASVGMPVTSLAAHDAGAVAGTAGTLYLFMPVHLNVILVQLKWELGSPVLGLLLRKWAPSDVYEVCTLVQWPTPTQPGLVGCKVSAVATLQPAAFHSAAALLQGPHIKTRTEHLLV